MSAVYFTLAVSDEHRQMRLVANWVQPLSILSDEHATSCALSLMQFVTLHFGAFSYASLSSSIYHLIFCDLETAMLGSLGQCDNIGSIGISL